MENNSGKNNVLTLDTIKLTSSAGKDKKSSKNIIKTQRDPLNVSLEVSDWSDSEVKSAKINKFASETQDSFDIFDSIPST